MADRDRETERQRDREAEIQRQRQEAGVSPSGGGGELGRGLDAELHVGVIEVGWGGEGGSHGQELGRRLIHLDLFLQLLDLCLQMTRDTDMTMMTHDTDMTMMTHDG